MSCAKSDSTSRRSGSSMPLWRASHVRRSSAGSWPAQPRPRHRHVVGDHALGPAHHRGRVRDAQTSEQAELEHGCLPGVKGRQPLQRLVQLEHVDVSGARRAGRLAQRDAQTAAAALHPRSPSSMVDQNAAHHLARQGDELSRLVQTHTGLFRYPKVCLVDQRRGLQRMVGSLVLHEATRDLAQPLVHLGGDLID
jgi:hypothetical protein